MNLKRIIGGEGNPTHEEEVEEPTKSKGNSEEETKLEGRGKSRGEGEKEKFEELSYVVK